MDLPGNLDLHRVVFVQVGLSLLASGSVSPSYNLPVHLYGLYHVDSDPSQVPGAAEGLRQYSILLVVTFALDLIWMYNWSNSTSALPFILILIGLVIKPISLMTCLSQLNGTPGIPSLSRPGPTSGSLPHHRHHAPTDLSRGFQRDPIRPSSLTPTKPGPSSVSHQAQTVHIQPSPAPYHEFDLDADAQNLDDSDLRLAKQELDHRIAQKQLRQQSAAGPHSSSGIGSITTTPSEHVKPQDSLVNTGYHTLE